jgi:hypothetical protein
MLPMTTCLGRLGSRFSLQLDPVRKHVLYGAVGLFHQHESALVCELRDAGGLSAAFPLAGERPGFELLNQRQTLSRVVYDGYHLASRAHVRLELIAPFLPRDERVSTAPVYLVHVTVAPQQHTYRWRGPDPAAQRRGTLRCALEVPGVATEPGEVVTLRYDTPIQHRFSTGEGDGARDHDPTARSCGADVAHCLGQVAPLAGPWRAVDGGFELDYDLAQGPVEGWLALTAWFDDPCFEGHHVAGPLKYAALFDGIDDVLAFARDERERIVAAADFLDSLITDSTLPKSLQDLVAFSFHSFLSCTVWAVLDGRDWFSVWEGSCWYNSTVDVEYNDAPFFFGLWPELLEHIFGEWQHHQRPAQAGTWLEHDMGAGWTCNGQSYHHPMEVEENSNWLLMLYAHGEWWGRRELYAQYRQVNQNLVEYLLWTDTTGNGFPDQGTANTIDDATPAVQYGRDQVYLGVKRLAALYAAARMAEEAGDHELAARCHEAVDKAGATLEAGWLGDHYPVCLDKTTVGLLDAWSHQPLPYDELPGWDAYSLYTTNGLLYLLMVDDLPVGLDRERLRIDALSAFRASLTEYGCTHSSADADHLWVSMNLWRDQAAGYLGADLFGTAERYWAMEVAANAGTEAKCFIDTSYTNNLCFYPRGIASLGAVWAAGGITVRGADKVLTLAPVSACRLPLLTHVDWANLRAPWLEAEPSAAGLAWTIENEDLLAGWAIVPTIE